METLTHTHDVFLSHASSDKSIVERIALRLRDEGVTVWFDEWNLVPGERFILAIQEALIRCPAVAVFIGSNGLAPWHSEEMGAAIQLRVSQPNVRVIPVLLPGARAEEREELPLLLKATTWVEFPTEDDEEAFRRLVCGIRGVAPGPARVTKMGPRVMQAQVAPAEEKEAKAPPRESRERHRGAAHRLANRGEQGDGRRIQTLPEPKTEIQTPAGPPTQPQIERRIQLSTEKLTQPPTEEPIHLPAERPTQPSIKQPIQLPIEQRKSLPRPRVTGDVRAQPRAEERHRLSRVLWVSSIAPLALMVFFSRDSLLAFLVHTPTTGQEIYVSVETNIPVRIRVKHDASEHNPHEIEDLSSNEVSRATRLEGAHLYDTIILDNPTLGAYEEHEVAYGSPGDLISIRKEFRTGFVLVQTKPKVDGLNLYAGDVELGNAALKVELVEGKHTLELRGDALKKPIPVPVTVVGGGFEKTPVVDLTPYISPM